MQICNISLQFFGSFSPVLLTQTIAMESNFRKYAFFFFLVSHKTLLKDFEYHLALGYFHILKMKCIQYKVLMVSSMFCHLGKGKPTCPAVNLGTPLKVGVSLPSCVLRVHSKLHNGS